MANIIHKANTRGTADHGWLKANHSFSFGSYYNPQRMGFGALCVINDDHIAADSGFGTHPHDNMEIVTVPLTGSLWHKDSTGNAEVIKSGEVQLMSAGSGITHSEFNHSKTEATTLLQIWVQPKKKDIEPRYDQQAFSEEGRQNKVQFIVSPIGSDIPGCKMNQDAYFSRIDLNAGKSICYGRQRSTNGIYVFLISGSIKVDNYDLEKRDAIAMDDEKFITLSANKDAEILIMEVPK